MTMLADSPPSFIPDVDAVSSSPSFIPDQPTGSQSPAFIPDSAASSPDAKDPVEDYVRANDYTDTSTDPAERSKKTQPTIPDLQGAGYAIPPVDYSLKDTDPVAYRKNLVRTATAYDSARLQHQSESPNNPLGDRTEFTDPEAFDEYKRRLQNTAKTSAQDDDAGSIATGVSLVRQGAQRFSQAAFSDEATNQAQIALNRADIAQHPVVGKVAYGVGKAIAPEMIPAYLVGGRINPIFFAGAQSLQQRSEDEEPTPVRNFAVGLAVNELSGVAGEQIGSAGVNALIRAGAHVATGSALQTGIGAAQAAYEGNLKEYVKNDLIPDAILGAAQAAPGAVHEFSPEARSNVINKLIAEHGLNRNTATRLVDEAEHGDVPETQTPAQPAPSPVAEAPRAAPVSTPAFIPDHDTVKQETPNANEEPSPAQLPVGEPPESSSGVRVGNPQGEEAPQARQAQGEDAQANREGAAQPDVHAPGQQPPENAAGGDAVRTLHPDIIAKAKAYDEAAAKNGFSIRDVTPAGYGNEGIDDLKPRHQSTEEQKLRNSVNEGNTLLRGSVSGEKRASIERSVKNSEARLAEITKDLAPSAETIDKSVPQRKVPKPSDATYVEPTPARAADALEAKQEQTDSGMFEPKRVDNARITDGPYKGLTGKLKGKPSTGGSTAIEFSDKNGVTRTKIFKAGEWEAKEPPNKSLGPGAAASVDPNFKVIEGEHAPVPEDAPRIISTVTSEPAQTGRTSTLIGRILTGTADKYESKSAAVREAVTAAKDELARLGQKSFPALNRESPAASAAASHLTSIPETKAAQLDEWISQLKAIARYNKMPAEEFRKLVGGALTEDNLRGVRDQKVAAADEASKALQDAITKSGAESPEARAALKASNEADAAVKAVKTTVGAKDSPFKTNEDYKAAQNNDAVKEAVNYIKASIEPALTELYKASSKWNAIDEDGNPVEPPVRGKDFGLHMSLNPIIAGEGESAGKLKAGGNIRNTLEKHSILERQATGSADNYELDLFKNIENALNKATLPGVHAKFYQTLKDAGLAIEGKPGERPTLDDKPTVPLDLRFKPGAKLYVRGDVAKEVRNALAIDQPDKPFRTLGNFMNKAVLASGVEMMSHIANQLPNLIQKPTAGGILAETAARANPTLGKAVRFAENLPVLKVGGVLDAVGTKAYRLAFNKIVSVIGHDELANMDIKEQTTSLARSGALQPPHVGSKLNPLTWMGRSLSGVTNAMRLALDDGFKLAVNANIGVKDTEANRRDYVNQSGNYHREANAVLVRSFKDLGIAPFAVAGSARVASGYRLLAGFAPGVEGSLKARTLMRINGAAQVAGILAAAGVLNYMRTGKMQPNGTPVGSLYLGQDDKGRPKYYDVGDLIGLRGALHNVGADAASRAPPGQALNASLKQGISSNAGPYLGPIPTFGIEAATGLNPHGLYSLSPEAGPKNPIENIKQAARTLNPTVGSLTDPRNTGVGSQLGRFAPRTGQSEADIARAARAARIQREQQLAQERRQSRH